MTSNTRDNREQPATDGDQDRPVTREEFRALQRNTAYSVFALTIAVACIATWVFFVS